MRHCKRGHPMTQKNSQPFTNGHSGKIYFSCRRCASDKRKVKYAADPAYRAQIKANARRWRERHGLTPPTMDAIMAMVIPDKGQYRCN